MQDECEIRRQCIGTCAFSRAIQRKKERDLRAGKNLNYFDTVDFTAHSNFVRPKIIIQPPERKDEALLIDSER